MTCLYLGVKINFVVNLEVNMEKFKRYVAFIIGLLVNALGVAIIKNAALGTSPITVIPDVLSIAFSLSFLGITSFGIFVFIFNLILVILQILLLRRWFKLEYLIQIPVALVFAYLSDIGVQILSFMKTTNYALCLLYLIIGCIVLGFGVYLEMIANVVMLPGESFARAIAMTLNKEFGICKVCFDAAMTIIALVLTLILMHRLEGVREGTIVAAIIVGYVARLINKLFPSVPEKLFHTSKHEEAVANS